MYSFKKFDDLVKNSLVHLENELNSLRTGGASPQLLDSVKVEAYGAQMKITELAAINVPDPCSLVISPWDPSVIGPIEKAIQQAGINLNPIVDGKIIRITVPPLTEESRRSLVKTLHQKIEEGKIAIRNIRTDIKQEIEAQKGTPGISEDHIDQDLEKLENEIKKIIKQIEDSGALKEEKLLKV